MLVDDEYMENCRRHDENTYHFNRFLDHSSCYGYTLITQRRLQKETAIRLVLCLMHHDFGSFGLSQAESYKGLFLTIPEKVIYPFMVSAWDKPKHRKINKIVLFYTCP